jgi:hypothetical protein
MLFGLAYDWMRGADLIGWPKQIIELPPAATLDIFVAFRDSTGDGKSLCY